MLKNLYVYTYVHIENMLVKTTDEQTLLHVLTASCAPALKYVVVLASTTHRVAFGKTTFGYF